jgi:ATP-dependent Clp protease ATP-binding subunit ClpA
MSKKLEAIMNKAIRRANELRHEYLTLEGVLLAMLDDEQVSYVLTKLGANLDEMRGELNDFIASKDNFSILSDRQIEELSEKQFVDEDLRKMARDSGILYQPEISLSLQRVIQRAAIHVQSSGKQQILGINLLVAMFQEKESYALYALEKRGIERLGVLETISHGMDESTPQRDHTDPAHGDEERRTGKTSLDEFTINLNEQAHKSKIDPLIGRTYEVERIVQILCRRRKNNPLLVGDAGVGKTAIAEGLALAITEDRVPEILKNAVVYSLDMASLLAGAKFRGDFEQRLKNVLQDLEKMDEEGQTSILFIDEIHTVMGAGATGGGSMDASNLLKPALSTGRVRVLGSTTHEEFRKFIEKDQAFSRRFQKIDVDEPSLEDTYKILLGLKDRFEAHHKVKYSPAVLKAAVDLSHKFLTDRKNPDKAIDVIDEAGAAVQLLPESKRKSSITKKDIEAIVSKLARVPQVSVASTEKEQLRGLKKNLGLLIFGQDEAIEKVTDAILMARSGLGHEERPIANFLFAGPTGVGKTELARQLAINLGSHLERFDMSEYMEKHAVAKLIGAPPGYVGFDQGGILTDALKKHPHCVLLLDEIEKAHPDIFNILLQVMDHGALTDSQGRSTDFRNAVIIMTTNAGAKEMEGGSIGLGGAQKTAENTTKRDQVIKNFFTPEFRNRLDAIIHFNRLDDSYVVKIVEKFLMQLEAKLGEKNVELEVTTAAKEWLARHGFDPKMGARPLGRLIDTEIKKPLSHEVLFGKLEKGGRVQVDYDSASDALKFQYL